MKARALRMVACSLCFNRVEVVCRFISICLGGGVSLLSPSRSAVLYMSMIPS